MKARVNVECDFNAYTNLEILDNKMTMLVSKLKGLGGWAVPDTAQFQFSGTCCSNMFIELLVGKLHRFGNLTSNMSEI